MNVLLPNIPRPVHSTAGIYNTLRDAPTWLLWMLFAIHSGFLTHKSFSLVLFNDGDENDVLELKDLENFKYPLSDVFHAFLSTSLITCYIAVLITSYETYSFMS